MGSGNTSQAAGAVSFAREQIGDMYQFAGAGPNVWDCSGLTMQAYASVGLSIGGHSATNQYDVAQANGQLVPYSQAQAGDLVFYTDGGGDMYHVAIYSGGGMMIEAPYDGCPSARCRCATTSGCRSSPAPPPESLPPRTLRNRRRNRLGPTVSCGRWGLSA